MLFTANEIVKLAGADPKLIGKVRVRIGGVSVNKPDHVLNVQDAESVMLIVGDKELEAKLPKRDELSAETKAAKDAQGKLLNERQLARREAAAKSEK